MYINYDMLESKSQDIIANGEQVMNELDKHKDVSFDIVAGQMAQLNLKFDSKVVTMINKVVECQRVEGVVIDEAELQALGDMIKEAGVEEFKASQKKASHSSLDSNPMSRKSLSRMAGDENDLLGDSPLFDKPVV